MTEMIGEYGILVGVDGSENSLQAVDWAAREAARRDRPLTVCHVFAYAEADPGVSALSVAEPHLRDEIQSMVDAAVTRARGVASRVEVTSRVAVGIPAATLIELAGHADLLVLGHRGHGGFASLLLGSVSDQVAGHAPVPVVVVRGAPIRPPEAPVVVGIDDSDEAEHALDYALDLASRRGRRVVVVYAYQWPITVPTYGFGPIGPAQQEVEDEAREWLDRTVARWIEKYPDVIIGKQLALRPAAPALVAASADADLLIVGSRGRGGFAALVLGSVSRQVLHHAECPVVVVR